MEALDLRQTKPRAARAELAGITFLPRSVDKLRAELPGGELAGYTYDGFTEKMFTHLGIAHDDILAVVAEAANEEEVGDYVVRHAVAGGIDAWHDFVLNRKVYNGDRDEAIADYPWLKDHPELVYSLDFLQYREDHGLDDA